MKFIFLLTTAVLTLLFPAMSLAHEGHRMEVSFEKEAGQYLVDVGHSPEILVVNEPATFDFSVQNKQGKDLEFSNVLVKIQQKDKIVFSTSLARASIESSSLLLTLPAAGEYELNAKFENNGEVLAEASFPFSVANTEQPQSSPTNPVILPFLAGLGIGLLLLLIIKRL